MTILSSDTIDEQTPKKIIYIEDVIKAAECIVEHHAITPYKTMAAAMDHLKRILNGMPSAQPHWIPISKTETIPGYEVLCCDRYGNQMVGYLTNDHGEWICESDSEVMYDTMAWMPLPKLYSERRTDGMDENKEKED